MPTAPNFIIYFHPSLWCRLSTHLFIQMPQLLFHFLWCNICLSSDRMDGDNGVIRNLFVNMNHGMKSSPEVYIQIYKHANALVHRDAVLCLQTMFTLGKKQHNQVQLKVIYYKVAVSYKSLLLLFVWTELRSQKVQCDIASLTADSTGETSPFSAAVPQNSSASTTAIYPLIPSFRR